MVATVEPDNIFISEEAPPPNSTYICFSLSDSQNNGIFYAYNPLSLLFPLVLLQMTLGSIAIVLTFYLLKPLGLPIMLAQILGGILVGPSLLCRIPGLLPKIFPIKSFLLMDIIAAVGNMFFFFLVGVQTDILMLKKINKKTFSIGFFSVAVPTVLTIGLSICMHSIDPRSKDTTKLPAIAEAESVLSFPIIAYYLTELRIINSDFGRVALCSSLVSTLCSFFLITTNLLWFQSGDIVLFFQFLVYGIVFTALIFFILVPLLLWEMRQIMIGHPLKQGNLIVLFLAVLASGFWSHCFGLNYLFGPLLCGLLIPSGPPLGSVLVEKLDIVTYWMLMPMYFVKYGLAIDIFSQNITTYFRVQLIALLGASGKFLGASLSALSCRMPPRDAVSLGFVMTFQGIVDLDFFKLMKRRQVIDTDSFSAMCLSLLITTIVITPIVRYFCNPSKRYVVYRGRTVMDSRLDSELRVLVCAYDEENVPSAINILRALNPCKQSPVAVYLLHLIELTGSAAPVLIPHNKKTRRMSSKTRSSGPVINAFKNLEEEHGDYVSVFPFVAISPPQTMHDDVCTIALDKVASLVIIPFYKRFYDDGAFHSCKQAFKTANQNVLDQAPCSVALLVDRGNIRTKSAIWTCWSSYEVAVVFLGGPDDREALTLGIRMAGSPNINVTLIRLMYDGDLPDNYMEGWRLDHELLYEFQINICDNFNAKYIEEPVMDGAGTAAVLRNLKNHYELLVVGRRHDDMSPLLSGLREWYENKELGVIGDLLASSDFLGNTTILVVQQHTQFGDGY
ncbi:hypothetical protein PTKIN_Ptkin08bG0007700 [Pterospermum kingtungense]